MKPQAKHIHLFLPSFLSSHRSLLLLPLPTSARRDHHTSTKMVVARALLAAVVVGILLNSAFAADITVGAPNGGWDLRTDLGTWASSNTFSVGDNLIFTYSPSSHDVVEVTKANYDSCSTSGAINTYTDGNTRIPLSAAGTRYFICGISGHCDGGMKVTISVQAASGTPPSSPPPSPPSSSPTPPSTPSPTPPTTSPSVPASPSPSGSEVPPPPQDSSALKVKASMALGVGMMLAMAI